MNNDRFNSMRTQGISTYDATATAKDITLGKTAYVQGKKVTGELISNSEEGDFGSGELPMPASQLSFSQTKYVRGKGNVNFLFPDKATEVDLLIKENDIPNNKNDYNKKYTYTDNGQSKEIIFDMHEDGTYASKYGLRIFAKNENGVQTAINNSSTKMINLLYPNEYIEASSSYSSSNSYNWGSYDLCARDTGSDSIFLSGKGGNSYTHSGLMVLRKSTNKITRLTDGRHYDSQFMHLLELDEGIFLVSCDSSLNGGRSFIYNEETGGCTEGGYVSCNKKIDLGEDVLLRKTSGGISRYNKVSKTFNSTPCSYHDMIQTSQGVFAYSIKTSSATSSNSIAAIYKYNESTKVFDPVLFNWEGASSGAWSTNMQYPVKVYEDKYGTVWFARSSSTDKQWKWDGRWVVRPEDETSTDKNFYVNASSIFRLGKDECYIKNQAIHVFKGNDIKVKCSGLDSYINLSSSNLFGFSQNGEDYLVVSSSNTSAGYKSLIYKIEGNTVSIEFTSTEGEISKSSFIQIDGISYFNNGVSTFKFDSDGISKIGDVALLDIKKYGNFLYAIKSDYKEQYILKNNYFEKFASVSAPKILILENSQTKDIFVMPTAKKKGSSGYTFYKYNPRTEELEAQGIVHYSLGNGYFVSLTDKKLYNVITGEEEIISLNSYTTFSNGSDESTADNMWSNVSIGLNVSGSTIKAAYIV